MKADPLGLEYLLGRGAVRWPDVIPPSRELLAEHLAVNAVCSDAIHAHGEDIYLACACAHGLDRAVEAFESGPLRLATPALARVTRNPALLDEVVQRTRIKLLVGSPPRIGSYSGVGSLTSWVRVVGVRIALDLLGEFRPVVNVDLLEKLGFSPGSTREFASSAHRIELEGALKDALWSLSPRERTLLRLHFLDRVNIERLAELHQVHRATVARWLVAIRASVFHHVKQALGMQLNMTSTEIRSLWREVGSDVSASVSRILAG